MIKHTEIWSILPPGNLLLDCYLPNGDHQSHGGRENWDPQVPNPSQGVLPFWPLGGGLILRWSLPNPNLTLMFFFGFWHSNLGAVRVGGDGGDHGGDGGDCAGFGLLGRQLLGCRISFASFLQGTRCLHLLKDIITTLNNGWMPFWLMYT